MNAKEKYKLICEKNNEVPLFLTYAWYHQLFDNKEWGVAIAEKGNEVVGFMPYCVRKKKSFSLITHPVLTPYQGVWLMYPEDQKYTNRLSFEKEVITDLISQLPKVDSFHQKFLPGFTNWLPFYWKGYVQSTRYTYIIKDLSDTQQIFNDFKENIRREIRKAGKKLTVRKTDAIDLLLSMKKTAYQENNQEYPISDDFLSKVFDFTQQHNCGELLIAEDEQKNVHSVLFFVWDQHSAYYLQGVTEGRFKTTGSMSLLLWEAIQRSARVTKAFNFEGSMVEPIERYFRAFGGEQTPYFEIKKTSSKLLKLINY